VAKKKPKRRSLQETWNHLRRWKLPRDGKRRPLLIDHHAGWEREGDPTTIEFFRSGFEGSDLSNLTLPRRYVNRSGFEGASFRNTDLSQSFMCWNDFVECDFTDADLTCCDMRASVFRDCTFVRCKLVGADLCGSDFDGCDFTGADLTGARIDDETSGDFAEELFFLMHFVDGAAQPKGG
jgi:uncharacterized protein YjbI with pentapeptide repeats